MVQQLILEQFLQLLDGDERKRSGIVLAKSPIAKKMGVVTGEPIYFAKKKCNTLAVYPANFEIFHKASNDLYQLLSKYTDKIERFSIDECFLDMTYSIRHQNLEQIAKEIQSRIEKELGFTVNIGISSNKLLAKMASDFEKPNKIHTLYEYEIEDKMWPLPITELFMLGKKTVPKLYHIGIKTIGDLAKADEEFIIKRFGKHGKMMWEYANGIDDSEVIYEEELPKSIGNSVTLPKDYTQIEEIYKILMVLVEQVSYRLRKHHLYANTVRVQLRTKNFFDYSHQKKLSYPTSSTKDILDITKYILYHMYQNEPIRLVGLTVDHLEDYTKQGTQISLFHKNEKQEKIDQVMDDLRGKFGYHVVTRAGELEVQEMAEEKSKKIQ